MTAERVRHRLADESGASIVLFAMTAVVLLVMAALALDIGNAVQEKRKAQGAADATALAAAQDLAAGPVTPERIAMSLDTAREYAADNLGVGSVRESVDCPGPAGAACFEGPDQWMVSVMTPYRGADLTEPDTSLLHVEVCRDVPTFFAAVIGIEEVKTCARATATTSVDDRPGALPGIIALGKRKDEQNRGKGTPKALHNQGGITILDGSIQVNSKHRKEAAKLDKRSSTTAEELRVVGKISQKSPSTVTVRPGGLQTGVVPAKDPLALLEAPAVTRAMVREADDVNAKGEETVLTLTPGVYGRLKVDDGATVVLQGPGVFAFEKIEVKKGGTLRSDAAMIYNLGKLRVDKATLDIQAMDLAEATSAGVEQFSGIALFQARCKGNKIGTAACDALKNAKGEDIQLKGKKKRDGSAGVWRFDGAIYAPNSKVQIKGESEAMDCAEPEDADDEQEEPEESCLSEDVEPDEPFAPQLDVESSRSLFVVGRLKVGNKAALSIDTEWPPAAVYTGEVALVE